MKAFEPGRRFTKEVEAELADYLLRARETDQAVLGLTGNAKLLRDFQHENALAEASGKTLPYPPENLAFSKRYPNGVASRLRNLRESLNGESYRTLWRALVRALESELAHAKKVADHCEQVSGHRPPIEAEVQRRIESLIRFEYVGSGQDPRVWLREFVEI